LASNLNIDDDNFINCDEDSLQTQIKSLKNKINSFTKWKIIISLYMVASGGVISVLFYLLIEHITK